MRMIQVLLDALAEVLVVPIREGLPQPRSWPAGLAPIMVVAGVGYLLALGLVLGAPLLINNTRLIVISGAERSVSPR